MLKTLSKTTLSIYIFLISFTFSSPLALADPPKLGKAPLDEIVAAMTLEEKILLVTGDGMHVPGLPPEMQAPTVGVTSSQVPGAAGTTHAIERLGIPSIVLADGPAGLRIDPERPNDPAQFYATAFPIASLLASSWDTQLVEDVGKAMGEEVKEYGVDIFLAPALNIHRYALGGRNYEYYSEDPLLSGKMAAAMIRGVQSQNVGTSIKHYVANNHEWNRAMLDVKVSEGALREIYLRGFEIAVKESQPWTVMSSYNKVNGVYTSESSRLLTDILREQWGFDGIVMTDWFGGRKPVAQVEAGNDLIMPGTQHQIDILLKAAKENKLALAALDTNVKNILALILKTPTFKKYSYSNTPNLKENARLARAASAEGMVLLKNNQSTLPLSAKSRIAVLGNTSYEIITGGTGSGDVNEAYSISLMQGLRNANFKLNEQLEKTYLAHIAEGKKKRKPKPWYLMPDPIAELMLEDKAIAQIAEKSDVALITLGRNSGEFFDRKAKDDFYLSTTEQQLIQQVSDTFHAQGKKVIVVLNIGGVIETLSWRDKVDAVVLAWQAGQETGNAIVDVLSGNVTPSGKLPTTFPITLEDSPPAKNFPGVLTQEYGPNDVRSPFETGKAAEVDYLDDIWVGYRYFLTEKVQSAYPFGFGLSYTQFAYSKLTLNESKFRGDLQFSISIQNSGKTAGREVVQVYLSAPEVKGIRRPVRELRSFAKTQQLNPGEKQTLQFSLEARDLSYFDEAKKSWLAIRGKYTIHVGASAEDIRHSAEFTLPKTIRIPL